MRLVHLLAFAAVPLSPLAIVGFVPASAQEAPAPQSQSERLYAWFEAKYEEQLQFSPLTLSSFANSAIEALTPFEAS